MCVNEVMVRNVFRGNGLPKREREETFSVNVCKVTDYSFSKAVKDDRLRVFAVAGTHAQS
jgi:hypothetical protein